MPQRLRRYDQTLHLVHNHDVRVDGGQASGEALCTAHHVIGGGPDARIGADDPLPRPVRARADRWRFAARDVRVQWIEERTVQR